MTVKEVISNQMEIDSIEIHNGKMFLLITANYKQYQKLEAISREYEIPFSATDDRTCWSMEFPGIELVFYNYE